MTKNILALVMLTIVILMFLLCVYGGIYVFKSMWGTVVGPFIFCSGLFFMWFCKNLFFRIIALVLVIAVFWLFASHAFGVLQNRENYVRYYDQLSVAAGLDRTESVRVAQCYDPFKAHNTFVELALRHHENVSAKQQVKRAELYLDNYVAKVTDNTGTAWMAIVGGGILAWAIFHDEDNRRNRNKFDSGRNFSPYLLK